MLFRQLVKLDERHSQIQYLPCNSERSVPHESIWQKLIHRHRASVADAAAVEVEAQRRQRFR